MVKKNTETDEIEDESVDSSFIFVTKADAAGRDI